MNPSNAFTLSDVETRRADRGAKAHVDVGDRAAMATANRMQTILAGCVGDIIMSVLFGVKVKKSDEDFWRHYKIRVAVVFKLRYCPYPIKNTFSRLFYTLNIEKRYEASRVL
jgi:hypothetical protein